MWLETSRAGAAVVLAALTAVLLVKGIVPAMSGLNTDFPNYLTAARIVADGGPAERLYDIPWFQEQMRRYRIGNPSEGKFAPFPPPTALLLVPLARFAPLDALRIVTLASLAALAGSIFLLAKVLSWRATHTAIFVLLSGYAIVAALRFGQPYILVSFACILGFYAYLKQRPWLAGFCLGLFAPIKYFPVSLLLGFAIRKQWKPVAGGMLAILAVALASIGILGWPIHASFLSVFGNHLIARLDMQDPFSASFQSFDTLFRRLFLFDAALNPTPFFAAPRMATLGVLATKLCLAAAAIATLFKLARGGGAALGPTLGILGILTLLLAPATATYHMALLWLPVGLLVELARRTQARSLAYVLLASYGSIGIFPYGLTAPFEGRGGLSILAYPRLWLLLTLFIAALCCAWRAPLEVPR
jgi:glycosyl transferase family 87